MRTRLKICCIGSEHEARVAIRAGVDALGRVGAMPSGLTPENVGEAIRLVQPYGLDICSGIRTEGLLDEGKLQRYVAAVNAADQHRNHPRTPHLLAPCIADADQWTLIPCQTRTCR